MHFVLCYPVLAAEDREALEAFRRIHEPARAKMVPAHISLVFGVSAVSADAVANVAAAVARAHAPFDFSLDGMEVEAHEGGNMNLVLKVGAGGDHFIALHRALYAGELAPERRADIEFAPHITIATNAELKPVITAAPDAKPLSKISGHIDALDVVTLVGNGLRPIATIPLTNK